MLQRSRSVEDDYPGPFIFLRQEDAAILLVPASLRPAAFLQPDGTPLRVGL